MNIPRTLIWFIVILIIFAVAAMIESSLKQPAPTPAIIQTPSLVSTMPIAPVSGYSYVGCYSAPPGGYNLEHGLGGEPVSVDTCRIAASNVDAIYFAIENSRPDGTGVCTYGNEYGAHGKAANCITKDSQGNLLGGVMTSATYKVV